MPIRVLICDDHGVVAEGLRYLVQAQPDMEVVALVNDGREAVHRAMQDRPDVVLMDIAMPILNGTEATRMICEQCPATRVIMLSTYSDPVHVSRALQIGAMGYIAKRSVAREVVEAIRAVRAGRRYLSAQFAGLIDSQRASTADDPLSRLSSRERQVLQMLAEGHSVANISEKLLLSPKTIETYRSRMMDKLGIDNFASLVRFAIQQGVTHLE